MFVQKLFEITVRKLETRIKQTLLYVKYPYYSLSHQIFSVYVVSVISSPCTLLVILFSITCAWNHFLYVTRLAIRQAYTGANHLAPGLHAISSVRRHIMFWVNSGQKKTFLVNSISAKEKFVLSSVLRLHCTRFPVPLHKLYLLTTPHSPSRNNSTVT